MIGCVGEVVSAGCAGNVGSFFPRGAQERVPSDNAGRVLEMGDMQFAVTGTGEERLSAVVREPWPGGRVPYVFGSGLREQAAAQYAVDRWNTLAQETGVTFVSRTSEADFVEFVSDEARCFSAVGRHGGPQVLNLGGACGVVAALHEVGHTVGLIHEHQRPDRNEYIEIALTNLDAADASDWDVLPFAATVTPYDYGSVMHYDAWAGSINGLPVIQARGQRVSPQQIGGQDISESDVLGVKALYSGDPALFLDSSPCI